MNARAQKLSYFLVFLSAFLLFLNFNLTEVNKRLKESEELRPKLLKLSYTQETEKMAWIEAWNGKKCVKKFKRNVS